jgi:hypothetical protein
MTKEAAEEWNAVYDNLGSGIVGLAAAITARAAPQIIRITLIYAVLDNSPVIGLQHLKAGLAIWRFCEISACQIFGNALGSPVADTILAALRAAAPGGISRTDIYRGVFACNVHASDIAAALQLLVQHRLVRREDVPGGRRPIETWFAIKPE